MKPLVILLLLLCQSSLSTAGQWQKHNFKHQGFSLPYQIYLPETPEPLPLIIHLHGSGEAGVDNVAQMYTGTDIGPQYFSNAKRQAMQSAIVLAPQTPKAMRWASDSNQPYVYAETPSTPSMSALLALIDQLIADSGRVDKRQIYITGLSRGGQGAWNAIIQRPTLFAAAVPIAGAADPKEARKLTQLPIWVFSAGDDRITDAQFSRDMVDAIFAAGGSSNLLKYTEVFNGRHHHSWERAYASDELFEWLLQQKKTN